MCRVVDRRTTDAVGRPHLRSKEQAHHIARHLQSSFLTPPYYGHSMRAGRTVQEESMLGSVEQQKYALGCSAPRRWSAAKQTTHRRLRTSDFADGAFCGLVRHSRQPIPSLETDVTMTLAELSKKMQAIDFSMLFTRADSGAMAGRPMSNNGDVEYDGDSYFFTFEESQTVLDIKRDRTVALSLAAPKGLGGKPGLFIAVEGKADLIRDKASFHQHWSKGLDRWFEQGIDTPGMVLIKVRADRVHYWDGEDSGEVKLKT